VVQYQHAYSLLPSCGAISARVLAPTIMRLESRTDFPTNELKGNIPSGKVPPAATTANCMLTGTGVGGTSLSRVLGAGGGGVGVCVCAVLGVEQFMARSTIWFCVDGALVGGVLV
jgi:hypothetical protein